MEAALPASLGGGSQEETSGGGSLEDSSSLSGLSSMSGSGGGAPPPPGGQQYNGYSRGGGTADGSEIAAGMADLFMSFTSPLVSIAELLLNTTAQIGGGPPAAMRRATAVEVRVGRRMRAEIGSARQSGVRMGRHCSAHDHPPLFHVVVFNMQVRHHALPSLAADR